MGITGYVELISADLSSQAIRSFVDLHNICRLYSELGPGSRVSLAKFAADHFEATGQRLRLAIDASIWSFQVKAGKGMFSNWFSLL